LAQAPRLELDATPDALIPVIASLDEYGHAPQPFPPREHLLHVPLFIHEMSGARDTPVFQSAPLNPGQIYTSPPFTLAARYKYICGIHGARMSGSITVEAGGPVHCEGRDRGFPFFTRECHGGNRRAGHMDEQWPEPAQRCRARRRKYSFLLLEWPL